MKELHEGLLRGHFPTKITQRKILDAKHWWPTSIGTCMITGDLVMHVKEQEDW
jgi:hypothetical protein